jgi:hypothetical protein
MDLGGPRMSISWLCSRVIFNLNPAGAGQPSSSGREVVNGVRNDDDGGGERGMVRTVLLCHN